MPPASATASPAFAEASDLAFAAAARCSGEAPRLAASGLVTERKVMEVGVVAFMRSWNDTVLLFFAPSRLVGTACTLCRKKWREEEGERLWERLLIWSRLFPEMSSLGKSASTAADRMAGVECTRDVHDLETVVEFRDRSWTGLYVTVWWSRSSSLWIMLLLLTTGDA
jgi:hypothetical protein